MKKRRTTRKVATPTFWCRLELCKRIKEKTFDQQNTEKKQPFEADPAIPKFKAILNKIRFMELQNGAFICVGLRHQEGQPLEKIKLRFKPKKPKPLYFDITKMKPITEPHNDND